ncbi:MAG: DsbE family thiol:disulfide interchange protein [Gammaproteobacteria bacterium]|nr:DsbE family thiol:disulfide interchange protein [Gammaproteobacteria bacterium]
MNLSRKRYRGMWPFVIFCGLAVLLYISLGKNPEHIPSPLIGKPAPEFTLPDLENRDLLSKQDMQGNVWLLNVWASWCVACIQEHPLLNDLSNSGVVQIVGLNYKDVQTDAIEWLDRHGNPYRFIAVDTTGDVGIDYGVYGVPETFLIDKNGYIQYKHIGQLTPEIISQQILPLVDLLREQES